MANNLRKFNTYSDYEAAELVKPAVSLIAATDEVIFNQKDTPVPPTPTFSGLTVHYNITDISQPTELFKGGGSGSGSGSGGVLPSAMIIDGTVVEVTNTYQFSTAGEHIVNYSFADNKIPNEFLYDGSEHIFNNVVKITIGDAITSIGIEAFLECYGLTSCTIGSGVTSIGNQAFYNCSGLTSIDIPDSVTSIDNLAFEGCSSLTSCTIGSGVTSIGDNAFQNCNNLTSIDIPSGVESIGESAFAYCSGLTSCTIGSGVTSIGDNAFSGCYSLTSMVVDSNNTVYDSRNNCNAIIETSTNTLIAGCESIDIPDSVTSIGTDAFNYCNSLTSVTIGSGVTSIGNWAFNGCSGLTSLTVNATTPPSLGNYGIALASTVVIYVPAASVSAYQTDWSSYASQIQAIQ